MKKIFNFVFIMLFLVSSVFAAVTITPNPAQDADALTCALDGRTTGFQFVWYNANNLNTPLAARNPLPASFTSPGDNMVCNVYALTPGGSRFMGSAQVSILSAPVNHAPTVQIVLPVNGDVFVEGSEVAFVGRVSDQDNDPVTVSWNFGDGSANPTSLTPTHAFTPGNHHIVLTASDGKTTAQASVDITVFQEVYTVTNLYTYSDKFVTPEDTFYRGSPLFVRFHVENDQGEAVSGLNFKGFLFNPTTGARVDLAKFSGRLTNRFLPYFIVNGEPLIGNTGNYYMDLSKIPLTDDVLGQNTVLVIAFDNNNGGGQAEKSVNILNNPLQFGSLPDVKINQNEIVTFDLDDYVSDLETPDSEITFSFSGNNKVDVNINTLTHVVSLSSDDQNVAESITFTANDNDGSIVSRTLMAKTTFGYDWDTEDRTNKFAYMQGIPHDFSFTKVTPMFYKQTYTAGQNVRMLIGIQNNGVVDEELELRVYVPGMQQQQNLGVVHLNVNENVYLDKTINLPSKLQPGYNAMQVVAFNKDNVQKKAYWTFVITH